MTVLTPGIYIDTYIFSIENLWVVTLHAKKPTAQQSVLSIPSPIKVQPGFYNLEIGLLPNGSIFIEEPAGTYSVYDLSIGGKLIKVTNDVEELLNFNAARAEIYRLTSKAGEVIYDGRSRGVLPPSIEKLELQRSSQQKKALRSGSSERGSEQPTFLARFSLSNIAKTFKRLAWIQRETEESRIKDRNGGSRE